MAKGSCPPQTSKQRQAEYRANDALGVKFHLVPLNEADVAKAMIESGRLTEAQAWDKRLVGMALAEMLETALEIKSYALRASPNRISDPAPSDGPARFPTAALGRPEGKR